MCGIAGFWKDSEDGLDRTETLKAMLRAIANRGPDAEGMWSDSAAGVNLGHRRLSILELSPAGAQPMVSACGRYVIAFNGEIYNHLDLRKGLEGACRALTWRGNSDTETLVTCFAEWGVQTTLERARGMFALVLWDRQNKSIVLARDRVGEKPLYYGWQRGSFLFGSELTALRRHPSFDASVDWEAATLFLSYGYVPAPHTIARGIAKLPPGTFVTLTAQDLSLSKLPEPKSYWSLRDAALAGLAVPHRGTYQSAVDELEELIRSAVAEQSVADVPVGAFLSGGIDSTTVVAMMRAASSDIATFSIGMPDAELDESGHAREVAQFLGTRHISETITAREAVGIVPRLAAMWDEPFADSSQIPTYLVSAIARRSVTVSLSGDGGDEFFLGYPKYALYEKLWRFRSLSVLPWDVCIGLCHAATRNTPLARHVGRARTVVGAWGTRNGAELNGYWNNGFRQHPIPARHSRRKLPTDDVPNLRSVAETAALMDAGTYLPDDILVKVDRATMAVSLESRAPLLDPRIIEFAYRLPLAYKLRGRENKRVLRDVLYRHVPRELVDRPKMGFSVPLATWLRGELRQWGSDLLSGEPAAGYLDMAAARRIWQEHQRGDDRSQQLWPLLMLIAHFDSVR